MKSQRLSFLTSFFLLLALTLSPIPLSAQEGEPPPTTGEETAEESAETVDRSVPPEHASARATMQTFIESFYGTAKEFGVDPMERAAATLDLSEFAERVREGRGETLAIKLKNVLDRIEVIDFESIPDDPEGDPYSIKVPGGGRITIAPDEYGEWLFTPQTVAKIDDYFQQVQSREVVEGIEEEAPQPLPLVIRSLMPESLRQGSFLLEYWQWLGLFVLALIGVVIDKLVTTLLEKGVTSRLGERLGALDPTELKSALRPAGLLAGALFWWLLGIRLLDLPIFVYDVLDVALRFIVATTLVWVLYRTVDLIAVVLEDRAAKSANKFDDLLVPLVRKSLKLFVIAFGLVFIAQAMGHNIATLLAGLGIGGVAIALAAQDLVKNLFGSLMVIVDRPFQVGDWVYIGGTEGTVEEVGFRSTRIRTFYNSVITLPNANLINTAVDNYGARRYRRWSTHLSLPYSTSADKIEAFCEGVRELIRRHSYTRKDAFEVHLNKFGPHSLEVMLYVFFEVPDWSTELRERHRLALDILRLASELGVEFAFPTQSLYLQRPGPGSEPPQTDDFAQVVEKAHRAGRERAEALAAGSVKGQVPPPA